MFRHFVAEARAVGGDEIVERLDHALGADARRLDVARLVDAGGDQHRVMLAAQLFQRRVPADLEALMKDDAAILEALHAAHHDILFQLEAGNAVSQQAARAVVPVIDMHLMARDAQIFRCREARGASADDRDRLARGLARRDRLDPAFLPGGVGDELLHAADGDSAMARKFDHAIAFAQAILRADAAADFRHGGGSVRQLIGFAQAPFGGQAQPVGDVIVQRAMVGAIRHAALRTAGRLLLRLVDHEGPADLLKIIGAVMRRALFGIILPRADKFQHGVIAHSLCSCANNVGACTAHRR